MAELTNEEKAAADAGLKAAADAEAKSKAEAEKKAAREAKAAEREAQRAVARAEEDKLNEKRKAKAAEQEKLRAARAAEVEAQQPAAAVVLTAEELENISEEVLLCEMEKAEIEKAFIENEKALKAANARLDALRRRELDASKKSDTESNMEYLAHEMKMRVERAHSTNQVATELVRQGLLTPQAARQLSMSPVDKAISNRIRNEQKEAAKATFKQ